MLLMTSYLVTIVTDSHQNCVKMCLREMRTATEKKQIFVLEKFKKNLMGGGIHPLVRPRVKLISSSKQFFHSRLPCSFFDRRQ